MILTEEVNIHIKGTSIKRYKELGYIVDTKGLNTIKVEDLPKCSSVKVIVRCDNCGDEKVLKLQDYWISVKNEKYGCCKCAHENYKKTMLEKYGVENGFQLDEIKEKAKETKIEKYDDENYNNRKKSSETCLDKYGVENPQQNKDIKERTANTNLEKYGYVSPGKNLNVQEKSRNTKKLKYDDEFFNNHIKFKETMLNTYGVDNPMKNEEIFKKSQLTGLKRKIFKESTLLYQGTYELDFLNIYFDKLMIENGKSIKIIYDNKNTMYHSDFFIPNMNIIVEIKSSYWYNKYYNKNIVKQKECEKLGYDYIIIIDKNYNEFDEIINKFS